MSDNENALRGANAEKLFRKLLKNNPRLVTKIKRKFRIAAENYEVFRTGHELKKSDVVLVFSNGRAIGVNLKSGSMGFNQITRMWLEELRAKVGLSKNVATKIQYGIDNYRLRDKKHFIAESHQVLVKKVLQAKKCKILSLIFTNFNEDFVKILAIYDSGAKILHLYDMKTVLKNLASLRVSFSDKGIIYLGDTLSLQRHGSDDDASKAMKRKKRYSGNQLQFKMGIISYMNSHKPFARISL